MHKIIMIGPFPNPIHGMSLANHHIYHSAIQEQNISVYAYNTSIEEDIKCKSRQGRFEFGYLIKSIANLIGNIFFLLRHIGSIAYFTPPQSSLGLLRYSLAIILSCGINKKTILHIHGSRLAENIHSASWPVRNLCIFILKKSSAIIALSPTIAASIKEKLGLNNVKVCLNGVTIPDATTFIKENKYKQKPLNILFLSNLMHEKGIFELLDAVIRLNNIGIYLHLNIAGAIEPSINSKVTKLLQDNPEHITYHGIVHGEKKSTLLSESAIFCLPSYDEGIPLSILEAYAHGCAVVTTSVGGIPDIFRENENGYLCKPKDIESLISALAAAERQREDLTRMGNHNIQEAHQKYSLSTFTKNIFKILIS